MKLLRHIASNADLYIAVSLGFALALLGEFGVANFKTLASGILAALALLVLSTLLTRGRTEHVVQTVQEIDQQTKDILKQVARSRADSHPSDVIQPLEDLGKLDTFVSEASDVFMAGVTLFTRTNMIKDRYRVLLKEGCNFRFVVLDPLSAVLPALAREQNRSRRGSPRRDQCGT